MGMESADHMNLSGSLGKSLLRPPPDLRQIIGIRPGLVPALGEGAELAAVDTDVGVIDMTVDIEEDTTTVLPFVNKSRQFADLQKLGVFEEKERLVVGDPNTINNFFFNIFKIHQLSHLVWSKQHLHCQ